MKFLKTTSHKSILLAVTIGLLIGIFGTIFFVQWFGSAGTTSTSGNMERHFIEQMIPHHEDAITMAQTALEKAGHQEIKKLAEDIIRAQSEENEQLRQWYQAWYGTAVPDDSSLMGHDMSMGRGVMHMGMMGDETDVDRLETAAPFDKAFIEQMIPHHQMAVMMANMLLPEAERAEMKQLANAIIEAQTREINQMRLWYQSWYGQ